MRSKLTILLAAVLLIFAATIPAFAAEYSGYISIDSVQAHAGHPFSVPIRLHNNNAAFSGLQVPVRYDSPYLTLDSVTFDGSLVIDGLSGGSFDFQAEKRVNVMYLPVPSSDPPPTISGPSGLVATLYFTLSDQAPAQFIDLDSAFIDSLIPGTEVHDGTVVNLADNTGDTVYYPDVVPGGVEVLVPTDVNDGTDSDLLPTEFALSQNYPNPFNPTTEIEFAVPRASKVRLEVFNILGQSVATLFDGQAPAGVHRVTFDASSNPSGIYFYRLAYNGGSVTKKMVFVK